MNHRPIETISARCRAMEVIRNHLLSENCIEVVTPILCPYPEIAPLEQFITAHPTLGYRSYLRVCPTEFLKRMLVLGADSIFEFSTNFRPEICDYTHLPEFTSLEVMVKGASVETMQDLTEVLCRLVLNVFRKISVQNYRPPLHNRDYLLSAPWPRVSLIDLLAERGFHTDEFFELQKVKRLYESMFATAPNGEIDFMMDQIVERLTRSYQTPVFIFDYPDYLGGPAECSARDARFKERSELFIGGFELANMSSSLTDPIGLKSWHSRGYMLKEKLGIPTNLMDEPLLYAVSNGLPESAVLGLGIERLLMVALDFNDISLTRPFPYSQLYPIIQK